jgi:DNA topoisomerase-1
VLTKRRLLPKHVERVTFNAITKSAVTEAMKRPRELDVDLIDAYRARRALDYLVGFTLSPVLWRKLPGAKSAGRVQSVSLRLIVDREREIELFKPQEYWSVTATMEADGTEFAARLSRFRGEKIDRLSIGDRGTADAAKAAVRAGRLPPSASVETKPQTRNPPPPFTTSTLQQEARASSASRQSHTMRVRAGALRGRRDHLYAHRRRSDGGGGDLCRSPRRGWIATTRLRARQAAGRYETKAKNAQEAHRSDPSTRLRPQPTPGSRDHLRLTSSSGYGRSRARWPRRGWSARR